MLRDEVEARLREEHEADGALLPAYVDYCIGNVPDTVRSVLGASAERPLPDEMLVPFAAARADALRSG